MTCTAVSETPYVPPSGVDTIHPPAQYSPAPSIRALDQETSRIALSVISKDENSHPVSKQLIKAAVQQVSAHQKATQAHVRSPEQKEADFVNSRKEKMIQRLEDWKKDYNPAPAWYLALIKNMSRIVQIESLDVLETFMTKLKAKTKRTKLASLLRKTADIMKESMFCMNTATETKMKEACSIIQHELKMLGCPEEEHKQVKEKKLRTVSPQDPLVSHKTRLMKKLEEWKKDFDPRPMDILACVPGVVEILSNKAKRLLESLYKGIVTVEKEKFMKFLESNRELMSNYSIFVNSVTAAKLAAACEILTQEIQAIEQKV